MIGLWLKLQIATLENPGGSAKTSNALWGKKTERSILLNRETFILDFSMKTKPLKQDIQVPGISTNQHNFVLLIDKKTTT